MKKIIAITLFASSFLTAMNPADELNPARHARLGLIGRRLFEAAPEEVAIDPATVVQQTRLSEAAIFDRNEKIVNHKNEVKRKKIADLEKSKRTILYIQKMNAAPNAIPLAPNAIPLAPNAIPLAPNAILLAPNAIPRNPNITPLDRNVEAMIVQKILDDSKLITAARTVTCAHLQHLGSKITNAAFSQDGSEILTVTSHGGFNRWNATDGNLVQSVRTQSPYTALCPHRKLIAVLRGDGRAAVIDTARTQAEPILLNDAQVIIRTLLFNPNGSLITGLSDKNITTWDVATGNTLYTTDTPESITSATFTGDSSQLAVALKQNILQIINAENGNLIRTTRIPQNIDAMAFSPDNQSLALASNNNQTGGIYINNKRILNTLRKNSLRSFEDTFACQQVSSLAFNCDGSLLVATPVHGATKVLNTSTGDLVHEIPTENNATTVAAFNPNNPNQFLRADSHGIVQVWNLTRVAHIDKAAQLLTAKDAASALEQVESAGNNALKKRIAVGNWINEIAKRDAAHQINSIQQKLYRLESANQDETWQELNAIQQDFNEIVEEDVIQQRLNALPPHMRLHESVLITAIQAQLNLLASINRIRTKLNKIAERNGI